jgi:prepilin-type N-terminal cleavage/methylation domain-containing protein
MNRRLTHQRCSPARSAVRGGFTLIELLMVLIVIAILLALLLPAINGAFKSARRAAVSSEIAQLAQALANFKSKYGDYPPSRFLAIENGNYSTFIQSGATTVLNSSAYGTVGQLDPESPGTTDINESQLAQRSVAALRKFWPRVSTTVTLTNTFFYDFNGNGILDPPYVMHGHECLVFFLGGVPIPDQASGTAVTATTTFGLGGFDKNPLNPFTTASTNTNRQPPIFDFNPGRLFLDPNSSSGIPGYYDSLGNSPPLGAGATLNFYAYFSAYSNGAYDPNDCNFVETDNANPPNGPIGLGFNTAFTIEAGGNVCQSLAPNPYTSSLTITHPTSTSAQSPSAVTWQTPQSFQIISSGIDGLYGVGGQYVSNPTAVATEALPVDTVSSTSPYINTTDQEVRTRERDNLTNFKAGTLE